MSNNNFVFVNASPQAYQQQPQQQQPLIKPSNVPINNTTSIPNVPSPSNNNNNYIINPSQQMMLNSMMSGPNNTNLNMQALLSQYLLLQQQQQQLGLQSLPNNNAILTNQQALPNYHATTTMMTQQQNNVPSASTNNQPPQPQVQPTMTVTNTSSSVTTVTETTESPKKKRKTPSKASPATKKPKVDLTKKLKSLEKDELIQLITSLPEKFPTKYDTLQQDILTICPDADVDSAISDLEQLRRNVEKAFPRAKYGTNRDDYAFKRVKPTLTQFKKSVTEKTTEVKNGQNWSIMCRYLNKLMEVVDDLPVFDAEKNNSIREALFKHCATNYTAMLKARDCNLTSEEIDSIEATLDSYDKKSDEVFSTAVEKLNAKKSK